MIQAKFNPPDIDSYITLFPENVREILNRMRAVIKNAAPGAEEAMKYQIPTFTFNGNLVHFAAYKNHIGFYPTPSAIEAFREQLSDFEIAKGTVKFPLNKSIPYDLIEEMVKFRVLQNLKKSKSKKGRRK